MGRTVEPRGRERWTIKGTGTRDGSGRPTGIGRAYVSTGPSIDPGESIDVVRAEKYDELRALLVEGVELAYRGPSFDDERAEWAEKAADLVGFRSEGRL